ncbi:hydroxypyruvate isomerase family protein [Stratiformator vulcanicus]|uniref:Hydroxypyruvate isomerase n=1 Tax=Stratiformator vulcanicus TaxID=2527980 RepID=A0A517R098_9PLAN|nr:TIM barrel protein [Stratiformator vulcanicus]QDT37322.1 Hydroxypyruvate isomerase [Stratiformator vulcanicus]
MNRRNFLAGTAATATAVATAGLAPTAGAQNTGTGENAGPKSFRLKYAPHFGTFDNIAGNDPVDQLKFIADQGFTALEDNPMAGRPIDEQKRIASEMERLDIEMGVFVANWPASDYFKNPRLASGRKSDLDKFLKEMRTAIEVGKRVNAKWATVVCGTLDHGKEMGYQTANVVEALRRASDICEETGLIMVLEPLNHYANHPELFLSGSPQAYEICRAVNSPHCKILFDIYHQQITEGNLIPNIDMCWDEIAYFQIGDNPGRKEPGTGEINYRNVFKHIHKRGFDGILGMEHGQSLPGEDGEWAVLNAYRAHDQF